MRRVNGSLVGLACVCAFATTAYAGEDTKVEVAGGYSFLNDTTASQTLNGWFASVGGYFNPAVGVVAEVGGNYTTVTVLGTSVSVSEFSFMAGPKFAAHANPRVTPFGQFLVGGTHVSGGALGLSVSETDFALQPGAGVDVALTPSVGLRLEGDYRAIYSNGSTVNNFRFLLGIVFHQYPSCYRASFLPAGAAGRRLVPILAARRARSSSDGSSPAASVAHLNRQLRPRPKASKNRRFFAADQGEAR